MRMNRNYMSGAAKRKKEAAELERLTRRHSNVSSFSKYKEQSSLQSDIVETQDTLCRLLIPLSVEHGGSVESSVPSVRKVAGLNSTLAATQGPWASPSLAVACGA